MDMKKIAVICGLIALATTSCVLVKQNTRRKICKSTVL